jgi:hypothetical protein
MVLRSRCHSRTRTVRWSRRGCTPRHLFRASRVPGEVRWGSFGLARRYSVWPSFVLCDKLKCFGTSACRCLCFGSRLPNHDRPTRPEHGTARHSIHTAVGIAYMAHVATNCSASWHGETWHNTAQHRTAQPIQVPCPSVLRTSRTQDPFTTNPPAPSIGANVAKNATLRARVSDLHTRGGLVPGIFGLAAAVAPIP